METHLRRVASGPMGFEEDLEVYVRARFTVMLVITREEERVVEEITTVCRKTNRPCITWDVADGFKSILGAVTLSEFAGASP